MLIISSFISMVACEIDGSYDNFLTGVVVGTITQIAIIYLVLFIDWCFKD